MEMFSSVQENVPNLLSNTLCFQCNRIQMCYNTKQSYFLADICIQMKYATSLQEYSPTFHRYLHCMSVHLYTRYVIDSETPFIVLNSK